MNGGVAGGGATSGGAAGGGAAGDSLSPAARALCEAMAAAFPGPGDVTALRAAAVGGRSTGPEVASVRDGDASGVPVRVYDPAPGSAGRPLVVWFHGGGWVMCGLDTHDAVCRSLAAGSGAVVVSADYRLAPEHPWPAAPDDALTVLLWARAQAVALGCEPGRVVVAGDSSGGNLAAVTALRAPELVAGQLLVYPPLDAEMAAASVSPYGKGTSTPRPTWPGTGSSTAATPRIRTSRRCGPATCRDSRARCWCWPTATCCGTRGWRTRAGWARRGWTARSTCTRGCSTGSWACRCRLPGRP